MILLRILRATIVSPRDLVRRLTIDNRREASLFGRTQASSSRRPPKAELLSGAGRPGACLRGQDHPLERGMREPRPIGVTFSNQSSGARSYLCRV